MPFSGIYISQGSVATSLRRGGYLNTLSLQIYYESVSEKFGKSVDIWWSYGQEFDVLFFWLTV